MWFQFPFAFRSTEYDSDGSEFDLDEKLSQPLSGTDWDISMAVHQYLESSPEIYRKILLYEPIWLEALRDELHINYNKKFKLSELMDYLDKMVSVGVVPFLSITIYLYY